MRPAYHYTGRPGAPACGPGQRSRAAPPVFGCSYAKIADTTCSATTIRDRRDEWIRLGAFAHLKVLVLEACDRVIGLQLADVSVDGCITKAPGGGERAGPSPVNQLDGGRGVMARSVVAGFCRVSTVTHSMTVSPSGCGVQNGEDERRR
jgi:hypothetical protein